MGPGREPKLLAQGTSDQDYENWYQQLMDDVQYGREGTRMILPLRGGEPRPQFDPKDVPIIPSPSSGRLRFDPNYSSSDTHYLAQSGGVSDQLAMALNRLLYGA